MAESVPVLSTVFMAVSLIISFALPIGLCIYFRKAKLAAVFAGTVWKKETRAAE